MWKFVVDSWLYDRGVAWQKSIATTFFIGLYHNVANSPINGIKCGFHVTFLELHLLTFWLQ